MKQNSSLKTQELYELGFKKKVKARQTAHLAEDWYPGKRFESHFRERERENLRLLHELISVVTLCDEIMWKKKWKKCRVCLKKEKGGFFLLLFQKILEENVSPCTNAQLNIKTELYFCTQKSACKTKTINSVSLSGREEKYIKAEK